MQARSGMQQADLETNYLSESDSVPHHRVHQCHATGSADVLHSGSWSPFCLFVIKLFTDSDWLLQDQVVTTSLTWSSLSPSPFILTTLRTTPAHDQPNTSSGDTQQ